MVAAVSAVLLALSILYVVTNRDRMTWSSAITLILSANFFLPFYLTVISLPNLFASTAFGHGVQYLAFLLFHAANYRAGWRTIGMLAAFILSVAVIGELYYFHFFTNEFFVGRQVARVTGGNGGYISSGFTVGILLAHFWFDSVIWRLKNLESRAWVMTRYPFLFGK
jgi:hypothetical protein